jgi:hypothetical protein
MLTVGATGDEIIDVIHRATIAPLDSMIDGIGRLPAVSATPMIAGQD